MADGDLEIRVFTSRAFEENAFLLYRRAGGPAWVVDPSFPPQPQRILRAATQAGVTIERIVLTHGHADHIAGVDTVHDAVPEAALLIAEPDRIMLTDPAENLSADFARGFRVDALPTGDLVPGTTLELDGLVFQILDTSGHSPGGRSLYCEEAGVVLAGDALFAGSIGRTDFHHGDAARLVENVRTQLLTLPDETQVYSGHGPVTTIGQERRTNPFVGEAAGSGR